MKQFSALLFALLFLAGCQSDDLSGGEEASEAAPAPAQRIVDQAIAAHGLEAVDGSRIEFDFRDRHYVSRRRGGQFVYERIFTDSSGARVRDVLSNDGLVREVNGEQIQLPAKDSAAYANSVNSVLYFALLPYFLNDPAVRKQYLGKSTIEGEDYDKVKVTFRRAGGGKDYEDEFVYWFHQDRHTMDYLAYNYQTDGGGARFRKAYNPRSVGGIRFIDHINYEPKEPTMEVVSFDSLYTDGQLTELSRIIIENPQVSPVEEAL